MKGQRAYIKRQVWKTKGGWSASVYVLTAVYRRGSRANAIRDLDGSLDEMIQYWAERSR